MAGKYTTTFDASHKVRASGGHCTEFARHLGREADEAAGFRFGHSNEGIEPSRMKLNRTMVNDGKGGYRPPVVTVGADGRRRPPSAEMNDYVQSRTAGKAKRRDAVALRPFVFKLDGRWYDEHCPNWRTEGLNEEALRLHEEALRFVEQEFGGQANIAYYSDHLDEDGYPERQIAFTPVTEDGRLSQRDFFKGPNHMRGVHKKIRSHLLEHCGYDADMSVSSRSKEHMSSAEYARRADEVRAKESELEDERNGLRIEGFKTAGLQQKFEAKTEEVERRTAELDRREKEVEEARSELSSQVKDVVLDLMELDEALWCLNHPAEPSPRDRDELASYLARHGNEHDVQLAMSEVKRRVNLLVEDTDEVIDKASAVLDALRPLLDRLPEKDAVKVREGAATLAPLLATRSRKSKTAGRSPAD